MPSRNRNQRRQPQVPIQATIVETYDQPIVRAEVFEETTNENDMNQLLHRINILEELNKTLTKKLKLANQRSIQWSKDTIRFQNEIQRLFDNEKRLEKYHGEIITEIKNETAREFIHMENEIEHLRKESIKSQQNKVKQ